MRPANTAPRNLELRSLALHQLLATRLRERPERLERIKETLAHWRVVVAPCSQHYVAAWQRLVDEGIDCVVAVALEDSEHAAALRQCSPLGKAINPKERAAFYKQWNRGDAAH